MELRPRVLYDMPRREEIDAEAALLEAEVAVGRERLSDQLHE